MTFMKENKPILIFIAIVVAIVLIKNAGLFSINLQTSEVQFYNEPIVLPFSFTNFTEPSVEVYLNDIRLYDVLVYQENETRTNVTTNTTYNVLVNRTINQSVVLTITKATNNYTVRIENIQSPGLVKLKLTEANRSETKTVEVRKAYVRVEHNIPNLVDLNKEVQLQITTKNPQGVALEADAVEIDIIDPLNNKQTISLDKSGNVFTKKFIYSHDGNYQFKIHAKKEGYLTQEVTAITSVTKEAGIHPIVYVWIFAVALWLLLFLIKFLRKRI